MPIPTIASAHARWNVVNRVFPDGELFEKTMEFVKHLAVGPPRAHDATKRMVRAFLDAGGVRGPMKRLTSGLAVALVLGASAAALASTTSVPDGDDVTTALDIAKASGAHNRVSDQLVHTVDFYAPVSPAALVNKDKPPSTVCVEIWTRSTPGESAPDYEACAGPKAKGKGWVGSIARKRLLGPQLRLGAVRVEQPTATRIVMRIDPDDIKRPGSYRWRTESTSFGGGCKRSSGCADYAPDRPATAQTRLSKPRS